MTTMPAPTRFLAVAGVLASLFLYSFFYRPSGDWDYNFGFWYGRDFINFWAAGRLAWLGQSHLLFDDTAYNLWLKTQFVADIGYYHIYSYPPSIIPLLIPFGMLPYGVALALWTGINVALVAWAASSVADNKTGAVAFALGAPAVAIAAFQGQMTGALGAAFFVALVQLDRRPLMSGVLLGLLTVKPHLGVVIGLIVLIERRWRTILAAGGTAVALVLLSLAVLGPDAWVDYVTRTLPVQQQFLSNMSAGFKYFLITPYAALRTLGLAHGGAMTLQVSAAVVLCVGALWVWLRARDRGLAMVVVALASVLVPPYANLYDMTLVALPVAALLTRHARLDGTAGLAVAVVWLIPALGLPIAMVSGPWLGLLLIGAAAALWFDPRASGLKTSELKTAEHRTAAPCGVVVPGAARAH